MPLGVGFDDCGTVWEGLQVVHHGFKEAMSSLIPAQETTARSLRQLEDTLTDGLRNVEESHTRTHQKVDKDVGDLQAAMMEIVTAVHTFGAEQERSTEVMLRNGAGGAGPTHHAELKQLLTRMTLLEARMPSSATGRLGGDSFQSRVDVALFVENHVPSNCFYLFHDVVTLLEALTTSHVERKDVLDEWYRSSKVGVNEASTRHMASFRLILPSVFGRSKEGSSASARHHLPSVRSFREWNTYDGVSGVKSFISSGMEDLKYQFWQDIEHAMDMETHTKARLLASEMHKCAQGFIMEMSSWIDSFYQELVSTSKARDEEAWEVVGACIKKVFEVSRVPRAQAANATMDSDPKSQCATYLWALVQSHRIMKEFFDARFRNHGAITPVIVLHIFKTRVTCTSMTSSIKRLEGRISSLEKVKDKK